MRVIATALAICAVSFLAGVAGDLSTPNPREVAVAAPSAHVELPPHLVGAVRAHPLTSAAAEAAPVARAAAVRMEVAVTAREKPMHQAKSAPKLDRERAPKARALV